MTTSISAQIPQSLSPFFQEYCLESLNIQDSSATIIERVLQFGNRAEIGWLFHVYTQNEIKKWVYQWGEYALPEPHLTFWKLLLNPEKTDENTG